MARMHAPRSSIPPRCRSAERNVRNHLARTRLFLALCSSSHSKRPKLGIDTEAPLHRTKLKGCRGRPVTLHCWFLIFSIADIQLPVGQREKRAQAPLLRAFRRPLTVAVKVFAVS